MRKRTTYRLGAAEIRKAIHNYILEQYHVSNNVDEITLLMSNEGSVLPEMVAEFYFDAELEPREELEAL